MVRETDLGTKAAKQLNYVRASDREDAIQVAWVARLEHRDAARAVNTFRRQESRRRSRELTNCRGI